MRPGREQPSAHNRGPRAQVAAGFSFALCFCLPPPGEGEATALTFTPSATILDASDLQRAIARMAHEIVERTKGAADIVLIGLLTRGAILAERLADRIESIEGIRPPTGSLDIGLYRDDLDRREPVPIAPSALPDIDDKIVVLVDDVLYTGRSTRAALDALVDYGRPRGVHLAVLVDRGHRELPIRADYVGKNVPTRRQEEVQVRVAEIDGADEVALGTVDEPAVAASERGSQG